MKADAHRRRVDAAFAPCIKVFGVKGRDTKEDFSLCVCVSNIWGVSCTSWKRFAACLTVCKMHFEVSVSQMETKSTSEKLTRYRRNRYQCRFCCKNSCATSGLQFWWCARMLSYMLYLAISSFCPALDDASHLWTKYVAKTSRRLA